MRGAAVARRARRSGWAGVLLGALGANCAPAAVAPAPARVEVSAAPVEPPVEVVARRVAAPEPEAPAIDWWPDVQSAARESRRTGRPMLVFFHADWSVSSVVLKRQLWAEPRVRRALVRLVAVEVDVTDVDDPEREELALRYQVELAPAVVVVDASGKVRARHSGLMTADMLLTLVADWRP